VRESLRHPHTQFAEENRLHLIHGERGHFVLQTCQRIPIARRQKVGATGENLADLDEGRSHTLEIIRELLRVSIGVDPFGRMFGLGVR
jgi:hypothetical protein